MRPRRVLLAVSLAGAAALAGGCGMDGPQIEAFRAPEVYLPPIAPEAPPAAAAPGSAAAAVEPERPAGQTAESVAQSSGAPSDAQIAAELKQAFKGGPRKGDAVDSATVGADGLATVPLTAPRKLRAMIVAGNHVARKPYVYGGGHGGGPEGLFTDSAYDCSGSISYVLHHAGRLRRPLDSGALASYGAPGRGRYITIYTSPGHAFMLIRGRRYDTTARLSARGSRWTSTMRGTAGYTVRHPPGL